MDITIKRPITDQVVNIFKARLDLELKKTYWFVIVISIITIYIIINGFLNKDNDSYIVSMFLGVILIYHFQAIYKLRKSYINAAKHLIVASPEDNKEVILRLEDSTLTYESFEAKLQYNWTAFSNYKLIEGGLYLFMGDSYLSSFVIFESELNKPQLLEFYTFLSKNLKERKY